MAIVVAAIPSWRSVEDIRVRNGVTGWNSRKLSGFADEFAATLLLVYLAVALRVHSFGLAHERGRGPQQYECFQ